MLKCENDFEPGDSFVVSSWKTDEVLVVLQSRNLSSEESPLCDDFSSQIVFTFQCSIVLQTILHVMF